MSYKVFTIKSGIVEEGARVESFAFRNGEIHILAILVGESGRGRKLGVLPVSAQAGETVRAAEVGETRSGKYKLLARTEVDSSDEAIVVFRTQIGFRGGNSHTGDSEDYYTLDYSGKDGARILELEIEDRYTPAEARELSPKLMAAKYPDDDGANLRKFAGFDRNVDASEFPGEILVEGIIAQGTAGRMGSGKQIVAVVPKGTVFRTTYRGRLYGAPSEHFYLFDGETITALTAEEREMVDLW